jgi:hypothetical protein
MKKSTKADSQVLRVAAYCRSAVAKTEDGGSSIALQLDAVEGWCRDHLGRQGFEIEPFLDVTAQGTSDGAICALLSLDRERV